MAEDRLIRSEEEENIPTEIICVVDRSGSMHDLVEDAVGGFNSFLKEQAAIEGEAYLTLYRFDNEVELMRECCPIKEFPDATRKTFEPRGSTALWDAIGVALTESIRRITDSKVIVVIITDGHENASTKYKSDEVKRMVGECKDKGWEFLFFGANIDAFATGASFGLAASQSVQYAATDIGVRSAYNSMSETVSQFRTGDLTSGRFEESNEGTSDNRS